MAVEKGAHLLECQVLKALGANLLLVRKLGEINRQASISFAAVVRNAAKKILCMCFKCKEYIWRQYYGTFFEEGAVCIPEIVEKN
jgi:hypothetical protein